jgi:DNA-binding NarL/FixJ family response regulator
VIERIRVLIAEDNANLRKTMAILLDAEPDMSCVAETETLSEVGLLAQQHDIDVIVLDMELRGESSVRALGPLRTARPQTRIVVHSGHVHPSIVGGVRAAGASAYVQKTGDIDQLLNAIRSAMNA